MWAKTKVLLLRSCPRAERALLGKDPTPGLSFLRGESSCASAASAHVVLDRVRLNSVREEAPYKLTEEQEIHLTGGDAARGVKLHELLLKLFVKRHEQRLPQELRLEDFEVMMELESSISLQKTLHYLLKREKAKMRNMAMKEERKRRAALVEEEAEEEQIENPWLSYRMFRNALFSRINKSQINNALDTLTGRESDLSQKMIIDCSYELEMDEHRLKNTAKQILHCITYNRKDRRPFSLHLCNVNRERRLWYYLEKMNPSIVMNPGIFVHSTSYTKVCDKGDLVYLSPHAKETLKYNPSDAYIIGGFVDKIQGQPVSNLRAELDGIRCAALPLDEHVQWKLGSKCLCIHQVFNTLLVVKNTNDWSQALLSNVPERKLRSLEPKARPQVIADKSEEPVTV